MKIKVSVIIAVYNGEENIEEVILSVINQLYENIELIIIDGGSKDRTVEIIKKYEKNISYWCSEKDKGISDAFNKGIESSSGDYIIFQGDGDGFADEDVLMKMLENVDSSKDKVLCGRVRRTDIDGNEIYVTKNLRKFNYKSLLYKMSLPHQGLFLHRELFEKYGIFDIENKFCMDYEHLLRMYKNFPHVITKDIIVANWRSDGVGNGRILDVLKEYDKIKHKNKIENTFTLFLVDQYIVAKYHIKKVLGLCGE